MAREPRYKRAAPPLPQGGPNYNDVEEYATEQQVPVQARLIANAAFKEARAEGCNCDVNVALSPILPPPFWRALVEHEDNCVLVRQLRRAGAPIEGHQETDT